MSLVSFLLWPLYVLDQASRIALSSRAYHSYRAYRIVSRHIASYRELVLLRKQHAHTVKWIAPFFTHTSDGTTRSDFTSHLDSSFAREIRCIILCTLLVYFLQRGFKQNFRWERCKLNFLFDYFNNV